MLKITNKNRKAIGVILLVTGIAVMLGLCWLIGRPLIRYVEEPEQFRAFVAEYGVWSRVLFVLAVVFQILFAFIPGEPFEILAGYAFGPVEGTLLCLLACLIGGTAVFFLSRKLGVRFVELFFSMDKIRSVRFLNDRKKMYAVTFFLFFIPGTPKDLLSYVAGLTPIRFLPYILIATLARIPSIVTSVMGGDAVGTQSYLVAVIVLTATAVISGIGLYVYRRYQTHRNQTTDEDTFEHEKREDQE